jgi:hypothetical protein
MEIGEEQETIIVEPAHNPFRRDVPEPKRETLPLPTPAPVRTPEKVPA